MPTQANAHPATPRTSLPHHHPRYTLEVRASEPPEVGTIDVRATVRQAVAVSLQVGGPNFRSRAFGGVFG